MLPERPGGGHPQRLLLLGLLGVVVQGLTGQVGVTCDPISVIGASGNSWYALPYHGLYVSDALSASETAPPSQSAALTTASVSILLENAG